MASRPVPLSPLQAHVGFWLRLVSSQSFQALGTALEDHHVTAPEWLVLRTLYYRERLAPSRVADQLGMTRASISRLGDQLTQKLLLTRHEDPADRRYQVLELTPKGAALVPVLSKIADDHDAKVFGRLTISERRVIEAAMRKLVLQMKP